MSQVLPFPSDATREASLAPLRESLEHHLARRAVMPSADALRLAIEAARALDHWHLLGIAHGDVRPDALVVLRGHIVLPPPTRVLYGWDARRRDLQALAAIWLELLGRMQQDPERPRADARWRRLLAALHAMARGAAGPILAAGGLAERLAALARGPVEPPSEPGVLRRLLRALGRPDRSVTAPNLQLVL